jgi:predicted dehydrogenase
MAENRRTFIQVGAMAAATAQLASASRADANSSLNMALIGCGGRGSYLKDLFNQQDGVQVTHVCDADQKRLAAAAGAVDGRQITAVKDMRRILDDKNVDGVIVATPDHWHAPASILACEAGKHVYVEKPCSHNVREGRLLVEAAERNKVVVQHGTQVRSTSTMIEAIQMLRDGVIGDVLVSKAWNIQRRGEIGRQQPSSPPAELDYDLWVGPATMVPYQQNRVHHGWHWWYHFGTGDMGNDGVHDVEYARWGLGVTTHPVRVSAAGGKFFFDDDQEFPDTQQVAFQYPASGPTERPRMLVYEQRLWSTNYPYNVDSGVEFYGTDGQMFLSRRGKVQILGGRNKKIEEDLPRVEQDAPAHVRDFLGAIRESRKSNADIGIGHLTTSLCHLGNVATRLGRGFQFDPASEQVVGDDEANKLMGRDYRDHWGRPADERA